MTDTTTPSVEGDEAELRDTAQETPETTQPPETTEDQSEQSFERKHRRNDPEKRIKQLLGQRDSERNARLVIESQVSELRRQLAEATAAKAGTSATLATTEVAQAKEALKRALADGDHEGVANAQEQLSRATYAAENATAEQARFERQAKAPPAPPPQQYSAAMRGWLDTDEGLAFQRDEAIRDAGMGFHKAAVKKGLQPESPEYFAFINERVRRAFPDEFDDAPEGSEQEAETPPAKNPARPVMAAAPRRNAPAQPANTRTVKLSREQRDTAESLGLSEQAYAASVQRLQQAGKL